jgi:methionine-rich copper-binding protein CopC
MHTILKSTLFVGVFGLISSGQAIAHAHLVSAMPAISGIVAVSPTELELKFSEALNLKFSGVNVVGPDKATIGTGVASLAEGNKSILVVPLSATLAAGTYTVDWHVLSKDGHKIRGSYTFTVKP